MSKMYNPFILFGYAGPEYFCDRERETEELMSALRNGRNITLRSPRRIGKTGLIMHAFERIKQKYKEAGYDLPTLVFWNVESRNTQTPATINDQGVILLSGASPAVMKIALEGGQNMLEVINNIINGVRYERIQY